MHNSFGTSYIEETKDTIMRCGAKWCNEVVRVEGKVSIKQTEGNVNSRVRCICNDRCNRNPYSCLGLLLFLLHNCLKSSRIILSYFYFRINKLDICSRQSRLSLEMKLVQMLQLGCQMERQLMRIPRHLLNLTTVISNPISSSQRLAEVSLYERHRLVLIHSGRA